MKQSHIFQERIKSIPYIKAMGMEFHHDENTLIGTMHHRDHFTGDFSVNALHGGVLAGFLETTGALQLLHSKYSDDLPRIININIDYLRSAKINQTTYARADIIKQGRRIATVSAFAWQDQETKEIVARADIHFLLS